TYNMCLQVQSVLGSSPSLKHYIFLIQDSPPSDASPSSAKPSFPSRSLRPMALQSLLFILFFFSSRRRHTRSKRDWSSDVCSSDLATCFFAQKQIEKVADQIRKKAGLYFVDVIGSRTVSDQLAERLQVRHESPQLLQIGRASCRERATRAFSVSYITKVIT